MFDVFEQQARALSTVSREMHRNAASGAGRWYYRVSTAQWHAERRVARPKASKLGGTDQLREYVQDKTSWVNRLWSSWV